MSERVEAVNQTLPRHQTIKKFAIISEPLTIENDMLTPTLKVKREKVYARFGERLKELYG